MNKVIWSCWLQGRQRAPWLVNKCLASWERMNSEWELRCVDQHNLGCFVDIPDLRNKRITRTSFSDIARILLLKEYGGIWTDATVFCNRPLDEWLNPILVRGFFAFERPGGNRMLASWFLASSEQNYIVDRWCTAMLAYWAERTRAGTYFWFHELFREQFESDTRFAAAWNAVPRVSATGPHAIQSVGMFQTSQGAIFPGVDWRCPVFKLTHRLDQRRCVDGTLLARLLGPAPLIDEQTATVEEGAPSSDDNTVLESSPPATFGSPRASTNNLEDHIQLHAGLRLLRRLGVMPDFHVDEIEAREPPRVNGNRVPLLLNVWFKTDRTQRPPNGRLEPMSLGCQVRLFRHPKVVSTQTATHCRGPQPMGYRNPHTQRSPESDTIDCFVGECLTLSFPRRRVGEIKGNTVLVTSRDRRLLDILPRSLGAYAYTTHYSDTCDVPTNMARAASLLQTYRTQARLIITTSLHCALAAIGMGIPVVVFDPEGAAHQSDRAHLRALDGLVVVYSFGEVDRVDWQPRPVDTAAQKLAIVDHFFALTASWRIPTMPIGPFAPASELPVPIA